jgi:hypothetical protein
MSQDTRDNISRRAALQGLGAAAVLVSAGAPLGKAWSKPKVPRSVAAAALDQVTALTAEEFKPGAVIRAVNALQLLGLRSGVATLREWIAAGRAHKGGETPDGIFAVMRLLFEPMSGLAPEPTTSATLQSAARPGYLRPPALGQPSPAPQEDLKLTPYFPVLLMGDIPLSLVNGYMLGGLPEPAEMHLDALCDGVCTWRTSTLAPKTTGEVRYLLMHWGGLTAEQAPLVEAQLKRIDDEGGL